MNIKFEDENELGENPNLKKIVDPKDSKMKEWLVNFVGEQTNPEDGNVTVEKIIEVMSQQFPEFLMAVAEENWVRGYHQALTDAEYGQILAEAEEDEN
jgi:hypothetical protein